MFALCLACMHLEGKMECLGDAGSITSFGAKTMLTQVLEILLFLQKIYSLDVQVN